MNRETKRMLQRQGQLGADGQPIAAPREQVRRKPREARKGPRKSPLTYLREVVAELRKVNWPSRAELRNYSIVVLFTVVIMVGYITVLDHFFQKGALFLFK